jgi:hypothetical protein
MESQAPRLPVVLHHLPHLPEPDITALLTQALPEARLAPQHLLLRKKEDSFQAFLMVPAEHADAICARKELLIAGEKVYIRRWHDYQVFVGRLQEGLSLEEVKSALEAQFGKIARLEEVLPHEGSKNKLRHLYLQFERAEEAEKCLFNPQRLVVKNQELRVARPYGFGQNEETDKKLFIKVLSSGDNLQEMETAINVRRRLLRTTSAGRASCARRCGWRAARARSPSAAPRRPTACCRASRAAASGSGT